VINYLESYAEKFHLDIRFRQQVISARYEDELWAVHTREHLYQAQNLVIAAGYNREPFRPVWPGQESFRGLIMHSSEYRNGELFRGKNVLVVGFGNSGGEIAIDLREHGVQAALAVRGGVNVIPRELFGIPILTISILQSQMPPRLADAVNAFILRFVIGDLTRYGLRRLPYGPITQMRQDAHIPLIDVGTVRLIKDGQVGVYGEIKEFFENGVIFTDGRQLQVQAVILATGYRPRVNAFLTGMAAAAYDAEGTPLSSGRESSMPGLYFCGYHVSPTGMLREIALEAKKIRASIVRKRALLQSE
jgi:cation diffusion facilitator CzcD-associated flavoprotein CzcO